MKQFTYTRASDLKSAHKLYRKGDTPYFIAGGTNLLDLMKKDIAKPDALIDLNGLELKSIKSDATGITIGALALNSAVADHADIIKDYPLVAQALLAGASPQIRNMATVGGNLLQRTRCPYFYDTAMPCNKRTPSTGCAAKEGLNRSAAIFGTSDACVAVHPSDLCVALAALDAEVTISVGGKEQTIPFKDFHRLPDNSPERDNNLPKGAVIVRIFIPKNNFAAHSQYQKIRDRAAYAFALVSVASAFELGEGNVIKSARIALGGVAHMPWRLRAVEQFLVGKMPTEEVMKEASRLAVVGAVGLKHNGFKIGLVERVVGSLR
jgi:xanthine dehydrogenase YagS FAD-binding subunit